MTLLYILLIILLTNDDKNTSLKNFHKLINAKPAKIAFSMFILNLLLAVGFKTSC